MQDHKSLQLCAAVTICAALVNIQTDRYTDRQYYEMGEYRVPYAGSGSGNGKAASAKCMLVHLTIKLPRADDLIRLSLHRINISLR